MLKARLVDPNWRDFKGNTFLKTVLTRPNISHECRIRIFKTLLENPDTNPNIRNGEKIDRPLLVDAIYQSTEQNYMNEFIELLLQDPRTNPTERDTFGYTALSIAVAHGQLSHVKRLLQHPDIDPNIPDGEHRTPLIWAVARSRGSYVEHLLQHPDIDPNIPDGEHRTPLMWAVAVGDWDIVESLLRHPNTRFLIRDDHGSTASDFAAIGQRPIYFAILQKVILDDLEFPDEQIQPFTYSHGDDIELLQKPWVPWSTYSSNLFAWWTTLYYFKKRHKSACVSFKQISWKVREDTRSNLVIPQNLKGVIARCRKDGKRFLIIPLILTDYPTEESHMNILFYDLQANTIERFEPHGTMAWVATLFNTLKLDTRLKDFFVNRYGADYLPPYSFCPKLGPQSIESEGIHDELNEFVRLREQLGIKEIHGYCAAWSMWWAELRLTNPDTPPQKLFEYVYDAIEPGDYLTANTRQKFRDYIRNYSEYLMTKINGVLRPLLSHLPEEVGESIYLSVVDPYYGEVSREVNMIVSWYLGIDE